MIDNVALGIRTAVARIDACVIDARIVACALAVRYTFRHDIRCNALDSGIADVADRASADRAVIVNVAQRIPAAGITSDARIYAKRVYALSVACAFAVGVAFWPRSWQRSDWNSRTLYVSVACVILGAETDSGMRGGLALRIKAALSCQASVHASSIQTFLVIGAILIQMTLHIAQHDRLAQPVDIGDRVWWTQADHGTKG